MTTATFSELDLPVLRLKKEPPRRRTLLQWIKFEARSIKKHDFLDGKIVKRPPSPAPQNIISVNASAAVLAAIEKCGKNFLGFSSGQKVYFPAIDEGVHVGALAICQKPLFWDDDQLLLVNPILTVEVVAKSRKNKLPIGKFYKYKTLESFREYVLVEQNFCRVETRFREEPGLWRETVYQKMDDAVVLKSLGVSISVADIYENIEFEK